MTETNRIRPKDRDTILQSLRAGVVPRMGQQHIQVGRVEEVRALLRDVERIAEGGSEICRLRASLLRHHGSVLCVPIVARLLSESSGPGSSSACEL